MAASMNIVVTDERQTERLGTALADILPPGTVVGLIGTLGAGKTRLVRAVAAALGNVPGSITSPTFVLVNEYTPGRIPVYHFDTYRLKDEDEFLALGPDEYFDSDGITFIEWADRFPHLLPPERLEIGFEITGETERLITICGNSPLMEVLVERLAAAWDTVTQKV
jgi:tRNA threonylcarbamoyladenosine biosynthesis protein TsaE